MEKQTMLVTLEAEVLKRRDGLVVMRLLTQFGDPVIKVHEDAVRAEAYKC